MPKMGAKKKALRPSTFALQPIIPYFSPFFHRFESLKRPLNCKHFVNKSNFAQIPFDTSAFLLYNMVVINFAADSTGIGRLL